MNSLPVAGQDVFDAEGPVDDRLVEGRFGVWAELPVDQVGRLSNHERGGDELPVVALEQRAARLRRQLVHTTGRQRRQGALLDPIDTPTNVRP